jgi:hypothetical protein
MPAVKRQLPLKKRKHLLEKIYFDAQHPASFGGIEKLSRASKVNPSKVKTFLNQQWAYNLHKPTRQKFPRRKYVARGVNKQWQADLVEMQTHSQENKGHRYILFAIDIFSRYLHARPLKSKSGPDVAEAIESIFKETIPPKLLQTDQGLEFYNQHVRRILDEYDVELFSVYSEKKAAIVERVQRTIQERMYRAFTYQGNYKWLDLLPKLIESYNHSYHRSIKTMPAAVTKMNESDVWLKQYSELDTNAKPKFSIGEHVRIPKQKTLFAKGYIEKWTDEVFIIDAINTKYIPAVYTLRDNDGEIIKGSFYEQELSKVVDHNLFRIEKVMRTRMLNKQKQALVKWKGYREPTWIAASQIKKL